jgi:hypothetical protein
MNALSDFMGLMLLPSPPSLAVDMSAAVLTTAHLQFATDRDFVFAVETQFYLNEEQERLRGFFLLLPDSSSLQVILRAVLSSLGTTRFLAEAPESAAGDIDLSLRDTTGVLHTPTTRAARRAVAAFTRALERTRIRVAQRNLECAYFNTASTTAA